MIKRLLAYILDIFAISIVVGALSASPLNPNYDKMSDMEEEYMEKIKEFGFQPSGEGEEIEGNLDIDGFLDYYKGYAYEMGRLSVYEEAITICCLILYYVVFAYFFDGQTVGKRLMKLKVVTAEGKKVDILTLLIRAIILFGIPFSIVAQILAIYLNLENFTKAYAMLNVITFILNLAIIVMIFAREDRRGLHDCLAKTKVIEVE